MTIRLHLLCSASTPSVRAVTFPANEPIEKQGRENLVRLAAHSLPAIDLVVRSPALCAMQTAEYLELDAEPSPSLSDCAFGRWSGCALAEVQAQEPDAFARWMADPNAAPHDGESFADVMKRVGGWMDELLRGSGSVLAITHPIVIRAAIACALGAGPLSFRHIDIAPLSRAKLTNGGGRWTLAALIPPKDA
jgi:broad specificity phosphatase PhoE